MKPGFDAALQAHFAAISNRDLGAFAAHQNTALDDAAFARAAGIEVK